ncbi:MAG: HAD family hydrolase [Pseudomonadales bacterium]
MSIETRVPGVLFDLDQTLIDRSGSIRAYARLLFSEHAARFDVGEEDFVRRFVMLDGNGYVTRPEFFGRLADAFPGSGLGPEVLEAHFYGNVWEAPRVMPGAVEGLRVLREAGVPVGIVTNGGTANQTKKVERSGLAELIDGCFVSEALGVRKPDPRIFEIAAEAIGIDSRQSWFVGDHPLFDICGSHAVGFRTVWLQGEVPWPADEPVVHDLAVDTLEMAMQHLRAALAGTAR